MEEEGDMLHGGQEREKRFSKKSEKHSLQIKQEFKAFFLGGPEVKAHIGHNCTVRGLPFFSVHLASYV